MKEKYIEKDYGWTEPRANAHEYLLPSIVTALRGLGVEQNAAILDAGCGGGHIAHELWKAGYKNIIGFDASNSGIQVANNEYIDMHGHFAVHDAYERTLPDPFPRTAYDVVLSIEVIEHLYRPQRYLENIHSWLKPGGYLILSTPYHGYLKNLVIALLNKYDRHATADWEGGHIKFFSYDTLSAEMRKAGITPVNFSGSGRVPLLWKSMIVTGIRQ